MAADVGSQPGGRRRRRALKWAVSRLVGRSVGELTAGELRRRFNAVRKHLVAADWSEIGIGTLPHPAKSLCCICTHPLWVSSLPEAAAKPLVLAKCAL